MGLTGGREHVFSRQRARERIAARQGGLLYRTTGDEPARNRPAKRDANQARRFRVTPDYYPSHHKLCCNERSLGALDIYDDAPRLFRYFAPSTESSDGQRPFAAGRDSWSLVLHRFLGSSLDFRQRLHSIAARLQPDRPFPGADDWDLQPGGVGRLFS